MEHAVLPYELLLPWSDGSADLQLALLLMVIGRCSQDPAGVTEMGVEALANQVRAALQAALPAACHDVQQSAMLAGTCTGWQPAWQRSRLLADRGVCVPLQVLHSSLDARQCYYMSVFLLRHLLANSQQRYWRGLRQLVAAAQAAEDDRLLRNPYLQCGTLLSMR
jgi:hypothetical protein